MFASFEDSDDQLEASCNEREPASGALQVPIKIEPSDECLQVEASKEEDFLHDEHCMVETVTDHIKDYQQRFAWLRHLELDDDSEDFEGQNVVAEAVNVVRNKLE